MIRINKTWSTDKLRRNLTSGYSRQPYFFVCGSTGPPIKRPFHILAPSPDIDISMKRKYASGSFSRQVPTPSKTLRESSHNEYEASGYEVWAKRNRTVAPYYYIYVYYAGYFFRWYNTNCRRLDLAFVMKRNVRCERGRPNLKPHQRESVPRSCCRRSSYSRYLNKCWVCGWSLHVQRERLGYCRFQLCSGEPNARIGYSFNLTDSWGTPGTPIVTDRCPVGQHSRESSENLGILKSPLRRDSARRKRTSYHIFGR